MNQSRLEPPLKGSDAKESRAGSNRTHRMAETW
jgi:hypothetical protein